MKTTTGVAKATRVESGPQLDGDVLNDAVWKQVEPIAGRFWQTGPDEGQPASEKTEVRLLYTDRALYVGVICYDSDPSKIVVSDSRRDASLEDTDCFQIMLDTYQDRQNGFLFGTNPAGIEYDAQITNEGRGSFGGGPRGGGRQRGGAGGGFNLNWDGSWEVRTKTSNDNWSAEFAIPFRTLRFANVEEQTWGINFQRNIRRRNEKAYWMKLPRQYNIQRISLAGTLQGLRNIQQQNLKVMPYTLGEVIHDFSNNQDANFEGDLGLDLKYSLTPSLTLDGTYNTDFAQVEVDEQQINFDRFNLFFPEKRAFFLENAGFFSVGDPGEVDLFFSRRIGIGEDGVEVPIVGGGRLSGKTAGLNIGLLTMQSESLVFTEDSDAAPDTIQANNFAVVRINKELPNRSAVGVLFANRQGTGDLKPTDVKEYNRTFALDGRWGIGEYGQLSGFVAQTATPGVSENEYAYRLAARYNSESWRLTANYTEVSEEFNPEIGFLRRSGYRKP
ncbi:carbohydrate binding family 9 domain-containing protein, partial [bacterium]|nr:carbohydrate binding family 9 domain-containing protein [bacterium]